MKQGHPVQEHEAGVKELQPFIGGQHRSQEICRGGMLPRELLANWLVCAAVNCVAGSAGCTSRADVLRAATRHHSHKITERTCNT